MDDESRNTSPGVALQWSLRRNSELIDRGQVIKSPMKCLNFWFIHFIGWKETLGKGGTGIFYDVCKKEDAYGVSSYRMRVKISKAES